MKSISSKIMQSYGSAEVSVKGFIAPIEYSQYNFHGLGCISKPVKPHECIYVGDGSNQSLFLSVMFGRLVLHPSPQKLACIPF